jgi:HAD superfamily hydrolase (TIGR01509 family)
VLPVIEALIFDVDGTLAETEELHRRAFNETFAAGGLPWRWGREDYRALLTTTGGKERMARFAAEQGVDPAGLDIAGMHADKTARYIDLIAAGQIRARPGITELIEEARAAGLRLAIATTTSRANVAALCNAIFTARADEVFDAIAAGDEVAVKKPAAEIYHLALWRLGVAPGRAVAFEDSRNGLRAAKSAGIACIVAPGVYSLGDDFAGADLVVPEFSDICGACCVFEGMRHDGAHLRS